MGRRLAAAMVIVVLVPGCLFVVPKTRRHEVQAACVDPMTKVADVRVHKGATVDWVGCGGSDCDKLAILGLLLSPVTLAISGLLTLIDVALSHDRTERVTSFEPRCGLVVPPLQRTGPPGG